MAREVWILDVVRRAFGAREEGLQITPELPSLEGMERIDGWKN